MGLFKSFRDVPGIQHAGPHPRRDLVVRIGARGAGGVPQENEKIESGKVLHEGTDQLTNKQTDFSNPAVQSC